ncbi:MAG: hypothetical protein RDU76_00415 [Candidatus Edwardsbacteria bacterium]|nr:hypothetical protein [Candidatus Edwardsbacteria bacterium]
MFAGCATTSVWQRWSPEEQKRYFGLTFIEEDSIPARYRSLPDQESRGAWYNLYWAAKDPDGSLLAEHRSRLDRAWNEFGGKMFFRDDRSRILVRYGPPESQAGNQPFRHALSSDRLAGGDYIKERSWMIWEYPSQGRYYDFLMNHSRYELIAATYSDELHPVAYFAADSGRKRAGTTPRAERPLECGYGRFRSAGGSKVRWEIYWRIPAAEGRTAGEGKRYLGIFHLQSNDRLISSDTVEYQIKYTGEELLLPQACGQKNMDLSPGRYKLKMELIPQPGDTVYAGEMEAELVGYRSGVREASDVEMAVLQDSTYVSSDFQKGKFRRVMPGVTEKINRHQPFYVYYEVYSLSTSSSGEHQAAVGHGIFLSDTTGVLKECIVDTRELFYQDNGDQLNACHKVHPMGLEPGEYILVIDVKDLISGRVSKITHPFEIAGASGDGHRIMPDKKNTSLPEWRF